MKKSNFFRFLAGLLLLAAILTTSEKKAFAGTPPDEGMWLPMFIEDMTFDNMEALGLRLTPEMIYSINNSSVKDAIVGLSNGPTPSGFFCTAEVVSDKGLLFTNHHCGYDIIQQHSSIEHDYLNDGFWARAERLTELRRQEQSQMQDYVDLAAGHSAGLVDPLDEHLGGSGLWPAHQGRPPGHGEDAAHLDAV